MTAFDLEKALKKSDSHTLPSGSSNQAAAPGSSKTDRRKVTEKQRKRILQRDGYKCRNCRRSVKEKEVELEIHHIVPKAMNGSDKDSNLATLCRECHKAAHGWSK